MDLIEPVWCLGSVTPGLLAAPMSPLCFAARQHLELGTKAGRQGMRQVFGSVPATVGNTE